MGWLGGVVDGDGGVVVDAGDGYGGGAVAQAVFDGGEGERERSEVGEPLVGFSGHGAGDRVGEVGGERRRQAWCGRVEHPREYALGRFCGGGALEGAPPGGEG